MYFLFFLCFLRLRKFSVKSKIRTVPYILRYNLILNTSESQFSFLAQDHCSSCLNENCRKDFELPANFWLDLPLMLKQ